MKAVIMMIAGVLLLAAMAMVMAVWASSGWIGDDHPLAVELLENTPKNDYVELWEHDSAASGTRFLSVMTWNIGFGGGLTGNPSDVHTRDEVISNLDKIATTIKKNSTDVVFLQEVDRASDRTGQVDQFTYLQNATGYRYGCFATTWRVRYLPFPYWPPSRHIGQVHSGQAILSRWPIQDCKRIALPQPQSYPWWYRPFYLHRSIQMATIGADGSGRVHVANVHLEAFDRANREEQARIVGETLRDGYSEGPAILAGDFNALPDNATKKKDFIDEDIDFTDDRTLATILEITPLAETLDSNPDPPEQATFTFPASAPTRRLDYIFHRGIGQPISATVLREAHASDHLPVTATFALDKHHD